MQCIFYGRNQILKKKVTFFGTPDIKPLTFINDVLMLILLQIMAEPEMKIKDLETEIQESGDKRKAEECLSEYIDMDIEQRLFVMEERIKALEDALHSRKPSLDPSKFIPKTAMADMIQHAISQGSASFGVSRTFIRKILNEEFNVPMTSYYIRKINHLLHVGTKEGVLHFDSAHQLYKLAHVKK